MPFQLGKAPKRGAGAQRPAGGVAVSPTFMFQNNEAERTDRDAERPLTQNHLEWHYS